VVQHASNLNGVWNYAVDSWQRSILLLDTLRERGDNYVERASREAPHVLSFPAELIRDGRTLERPVNYLLVRIVPPAGIEIDPAKPPIVVVDPRAGHGPGIGGMKSESEIGEALKAGHACYFIGFLPNPMPGQTIEDVCRAEAFFIGEIAARHPDAEGKPIVIANCQAGWQTMIMAAIHPDLAGPILLAGTPLSYWAGVRGKNPMRYTGGVLGGTWMTALAGDLGNGIFDGAHLVANFESLNPANTYWTKAYNVYSKVDTETERFLEFETWWGNPVLLNASEMQWIADNLFVGDKLSTGQIRTTDGLRIDLRNIKSPIVVFCSWGDDITPPQQALGWILDLYDDVSEIVANGQTIVYTMHESIGHLGIFVSGKVAAKEHSEFVSCMDLIDVTPPGLYEAVISEIADGPANRDLIDGKYLFRLETRTLDDLRALGGNDAADDERFATAARVSEINLGLYRTFAQPWIRAWTSEAGAKALREMHPHRLRFGSFSEQNPLMRRIKPVAEEVRSNRKAVKKDNPLLAAERTASSWITTWLQTAGDVRDAMTEALFLNAYGSPWLQAAVGLGAQETETSRRIERDLAREAAAAELRANLEARFEQGGAAEAVLRALMYIRLPDGAIDERGFRMLKIVRDARAASDRMSLARFKAVAREQMQLVLLDAERAVNALPKLLNPDEPAGATALEALRRLLSARGPLEGESKARFARIEALLGVETSVGGVRRVARG
jgi:pimeloyl-ACP methyl ester carboxylesterase